MSVSHRLLIGSPLLLITLFCFGFLGWQQHSASLVSSSSRRSASSVSRRKDLTVTKPDAQTVTPPGQTGTPPSDPEDTVTPQLPAVASTHIQQADQKRDAAPNSDNAATQAVIQQLNSTIKH